MKLESLLNLPTPVRRALLIAGDMLAVLVAVWASFAIRVGEWWPDLLPDVAWLFPLAVVIVIPTFAAVGLYRPILRYADESLLYTILFGASAGVLLMMAVWVLAGDGFVAALILADLLAGTDGAGGRRPVVAAPLFATAVSPGGSAHPAIIYGAGEAGAQLVNALRYSAEFEPVVFVDDNPRLVGAASSGASRSGRRPSCRA